MMALLGALLSLCVYAQVTIGRLSGNAVVIADNEVSGQHAALRWEPSCRCWQVGRMHTNPCLMPALLSSKPCLVSGLSQICSLTF
jgi:hypothetical protein